MEIVFIDSNDKQRSLYRIYLENILEDCVVHEFFSFKNAEKFLKKNSNRSERPFAFVLANTNGRDGELSEFYDNFRSLFKMTPFVLFSEDPVDLITGMESFFSHHPQNSHIQLPISPADFREKFLALFILTA
jgi:hypothetical protein